MQLFSRLEQLNTPNAFLLRSMVPKISVLDMALNNLMVIHTFPKSINVIWNTILSRMWMVNACISYDDKHYINRERERERESDCHFFAEESHLFDVLRVTVNFWRMWSTPLLQLLPGPLWLGFVLPVKVPSMVQIEIFSHFLYFKLLNSVKNKWMMSHWIISLR